MSTRIHVHVHVHVHACAGQLYMQMNTWQVLRVFGIGITSLLHYIFMRITSYKNNSSG